MIKNEEYSLLNKRISNSDMENFCSIFEEKGVQFSCEVLIQDGPRYTYKYTKSKKEPNPFKSNFFRNLQISTIKFNSKYCKLQYGEECDNKITFEGEEKDELYQYFFTNINDWKEKLVKLKRLRIVTNSNFFLFTIISTLFIIGLTIGYGFLSAYINKSILSTILSSVFLGLGLLFVMGFYTSAFSPYEIKIGLCKYKNDQKIFFGILTSCIIPIVLGLVV